jgi:hypothetical protein
MWFKRSEPDVAGELQRSDSAAAGDNYYFPNDTGAVGICRTDAGAGPCRR